MQEDLIILGASVRRSRPCCAVVSRGAALYGDKIFFCILDASMVALDAKLGKVIWNDKLDDYTAGYAYKGAPNIIKDGKTGKIMRIHGTSSDYFGAWGKLYARDPDTGEEFRMWLLVEGQVGRLNGKDSTLTGDAQTPFWPARTARRSRPRTMASAGRLVPTTTGLTPSSWAPATRPRRTTIAAPSVTGFTPRIKFMARLRPAIRWVSISTYRTMTGTSRVATRSSPSTRDGFVKALDAKSGKERWKFQTGSGVFLMRWPEKGAGSGMSASPGSGGRHAASAAGRWLGQGPGLSAGASFNRAGRLDDLRGERADHRR